jgi:signal peptidase I
MTSSSPKGAVDADHPAAANGAVAAAGERPGRAPRKPPKPAVRAITELVVIVAVALGLAFGIQAVVVKPYKIPSGSMEPTLAIGQRVLVNRLGMELGHPSVGQIAVFHPPLAAEQAVCGPQPHRVAPGGSACSAPVAAEGSVNFIKRIVAGPGDSIYVRAGHVWREAAGTHEFLREPDSYIKATCDGAGAPAECNFPVPITIPAGHWFMMGDNRGDSDDSRFWGPVPTGWIIGEAFFTYWPPDRIGTL